jgi:cardiolipin synthase
MARSLNLANCISLLRLLLAPFVIRAILLGRNTEALVLFAVAAVTDVLDGAAARRFRMETPSGAYLDPIADKVLLSGVFLALAGAGTVPWWYVALVFGRDLFILLGAGLLLSLARSRRYPPSIWGKASTFFQILTAVAWMAQNMLGNTVLQSAAWTFLWLSAALTAWSGIHYTWRGIQQAARIDGLRARE